MRHYYFPATLDSHEDGSGRYDVTFTDLPGCVSQGKDLGDALHMAREDLTVHISMLADGDPIPEPSALKAAQQADEEEAYAEGLALAQGTIWQYISIEAVPRKPALDAPVRLSISLKLSVIAKIDAFAGDQGLTRSGVSNVAIHEYINRHAGL